MKVSDTRIQSAGVFDCCLDDVACEYAGKEVEIGYVSVCPKCGEKFTLVQSTGYALWTPDWKLFPEEGE